MKRIVSKKNITYFIFSLVCISFFLGLFLNENSAGAGGYREIKWILKNIEIFKNNNLKDAILHDEFFGNRSPLLYILNDFFNPFFYEYQKYRISVFILSLTGPVFFYYCLKIKYPKINKEILILLSSVILLSPYYRTTAFWGLNENYGLVFSIISIMFLYIYLKKLNLNKENNAYLFLTIFFSSLTPYFDLKLLIVTIFCFLYIVNSLTNIKIKIITFMIYILLGLPYLFLIIHWEGLVPPLSQAGNENTITSFSKLKYLHFYHLGYACTIIAFYLFPFLFLKEKSFVTLIKNFLSQKRSVLVLLIPLVYILLIYLYYEFNSYTVENYWIGLGVVNKFANIFFFSETYKEIFTYIMFGLSWFVVCLFIEEKNDFFILLFFFLISLILWPLMQEYFDPIMLILCLLLFKTKLIFNHKNVIFLTFYYSLFLGIANFYYAKTLLS